MRCSAEEAGKGEERVMRRGQPFCWGVAWLAMAAAVGWSAVVGQQAAEGGQAYLAGHNSARALVGVTALVWDATLVRYAQRYADEQRAANACRLLRPSNGPFGENKFWGSPGKAWTASDAVSSWLAYARFYNASTNTCLPATQPCGLYTQIVWRNTTSLGCASSLCADNSTFIICSYNPPGNIIGQRPF